MSFCWMELLADMTGEQETLLLSPGLESAHPPSVCSARTLGKRSLGPVDSSSSEEQQRTSLLFFSSPLLSSALLRPSVHTQSLFHPHPPSPASKQDLPFSPLLWLAQRTNLVHPQSLSLSPRFDRVLGRSLRSFHLALTSEYPTNDETGPGIRSAAVAIGIALRKA